MLSNRLIVGWCFGVLMASVASSAANSAGLDATATQLAQIAPDRASQPAAIPNTAKLSLQMSPDQAIPVGTKISFRVTTAKPGYLLLIDIDADGRMSQIFPSPEMIVQSEEAAANFLRPGDELVIPNSAARKSGFEYVITPPT